MREYFGQQSYACAAEQEEDERMTNRSIQNAAGDRSEQFTRE
jgi:hypothetical protein